MNSMIEDIILNKDWRSISKLRRYLPQDFCKKASEFIFNLRGRIIIVTGFYTNEDAENDGLVGAIFLGNALRKLGNAIFFVTDKFALRYLEQNLNFEAEVIDFPITEGLKSKSFAFKLRDRIKPCLIISVERCGITQSGKYLNMHGLDISGYTAKLDYLFEYSNTVSIGDFGNEIGMGLLSEKLRQELNREPSITKAKYLVIAATSNWGCYGILAYLTLFSGKNLLPSPEEEERLFKKIVDQGAVHGLTGKREYFIDGFSLKENREVIEKLNKYCVNFKRERNETRSY